MGNTLSEPNGDSYDPSTDPVDTSDIEGHHFPYENLVLEGGGVKACAYAGAFEVLEKVGVLKNIKRIAGTSGGAIAATLLALGCSPQEISTRFTPWDELLDARFGRASYCYNLINVFGFNPGVKAHATISRHIGELSGDPKYTFKQLYEDRGIELCIVACNINGMTIEYFHPKTTPHAEIADAVRMSMSIPVVMAPWKGTNGKAFYVDGGVLCNFPIHVFDGWYLSMDPKDSFFRRLPEGKKSWFNTFNEKTLGICVHETGEVDKMIMSGKAKCHEIEVKRPNTPQAREKGKVCDDQLKSMDDKAKLCNAVNVILQNVGKFDKDGSGALRKEEWLASLNSGDRELEAAYKTVFGDNAIPEEILKQVNAGEEFDFEMFAKYVESHNDISICEVKESVSLLPVSNFMEFMSALLHTWQNGNANRFFSEHDPGRTISIYTDYIGSLDIDIEQLDLEFLKRQGRLAAVNFLKLGVKH